ncbi:MAG TPA: GNAT family N-acetyltransferase [Hyphomonadaceae bacterium]|nr:GNAT family N-acetyltransferase [Hyphomonadaceae bacterium]
MTAPSFRYAVEADVSPLVALIERAYRSPETAGSWVSEAHLLKGPRTSSAEISDLISQPDSRFLIAERNDRILGCCLVQRMGTTECSSGEIGRGSAYFGMFAIDPADHSTGLGKQILAEAERRVRDLWRSDSMVMTVINLREQLIEYYKRRGYVLTGATMPFPFSETSGEVTRDFHLVEMKKDLA